MANTLTGLIPDLYAALDEVSRELVGFIPAVARNSTAERAAVGELVKYHIAPSGNSDNISPAMTIPEPTDQTIGVGSISITKAKASEFGWVGESQRGLNNGPGYLSVQADMIAQSMRTLTNEVEADLALAASIAASRAVGTAGTTPFATDISALYDSRKVMVDNGAPPNNLQMVIDTTAGANVRTLFGINTNRDFSNASISEQGILHSREGLAIRESGQTITKTAGTVTDTTVTGVNAVGATTINVTTAVTTGSVILTAGDVIIFAGDSNAYVVASDVTIADNTTGNVVIQEPGLRVATAGSEEASTAASNFTANVAFYRNAIQLVTRAPEVPAEGDAATDTMMITDPRSGLSFEARVYPGYRKSRFEIALAWGYAVTQPRHTALLLG